MARYAAADIAHLHQAIETVTTATDDPVRQVVEFVRFFEDTADELMAAQSSCLYVSILTERQLAQEGTSEQIVQAILAWRKELSLMIERALTCVSGTSGIDAGALANHVFVTFEGAFILARSTGEPDHMRAQLRVLRHLLAAMSVSRTDTEHRRRCSTGGRSGSVSVLAVLRVGGGAGFPCVEWPSRDIGVQRPTVQELATVAVGDACQVSSHGRWST